MISADLQFTINFYITVIMSVLLVICFISFIIADAYTEDKDIKTYDIVARVRKEIREIS